MKLETLYKTLGDDAVLLPVPKGKKKPPIDKWERLTLADTKTRKFQRALAWSAEHGNIALRHGPNIQSIDIDDDELIEPFLKLNPSLRNTSQTKGKRGCQFHVRMTGDYPNEKGIYKIAHKTKRDRNGRPLTVMELRVGGTKGSTSIVSGTHPDGITYQLNGKQPVKIEFNTIECPPECVLNAINSPCRRC